MNKIYLATVYAAHDFNARHSVEAFASYYDAAQCAENAIKALMDAALALDPSDYVTSYYYDIDAIAFTHA